MTASDENATEMVEARIGPAVRRIRLDTLVRLRWLAVAGQSAAVLFVALALEFPLPTGLCFVLILMSAGLNLVLGMKFPANHRLFDSQAVLLLAWDISQLAILLYLTGGLENPFSFLLLAPVTVSATILPTRSTVLLAGLVMAATSILAVYHLPLPWKPGETLEFPMPFVAGIWAAMVLTLGFLSVYTFQVAKEAREMSDALAATELVLAHEQRLSDLDGLAAAAAHELGTPLGTIAVVSKELGRELPADSPLQDDVRLLLTQSERCREILGKLTSLSSSDARMFAEMDLRHLIEDVVAPQRDFGIDIVIDLNGPADSAPATRRSPAVLYGLSNFLENAVDFAERQVRVEADWNDSEVIIAIVDDGPGFPPALMHRIGDPYITSRPRTAAGRNDDKSGGQTGGGQTGGGQTGGGQTGGGQTGGGQTGGGLGLGVFIAKTLLQRSGARVAVANRKPPATGARVSVTWPRREFEFESGTGNDPGNDPGSDPGSNPGQETAATD